MEFVPAGRVMVSLCVPGPFTGVILSKPQKFHRVPRGEEARPGTESDWTRVTLPGHEICRDPALPGASPVGFLPSFPITLGWRQQAGPPAVFVWGLSGGRSCQRPIFWAREGWVIRGPSCGARTIKIKQQGLLGSLDQGTNCPSEELLCSWR